MVSLWVGGKRLCTASLISPSHILSAAHCFGLEGNYSILAGTVDAIQNNTKSIGKNIVKAHIYSEDLLGKDLAIGVVNFPFYFQKLFQINSVGRTVKNLGRSTSSEIDKTSKFGEFQCIYCRMGTS
jgi:secreted trypsin-like serine protease